MTPLERCNMIRDQTEGFRRRAMLKHQIIRHIQETETEALDQVLFLIHEKYPATQENLVADIRAFKNKL